MGLDLLDIVFRLERSFGIKIPRGDFDKLLSPEEPRDIRIGDLFNYVHRRVRSADVSDRDLYDRDLDDLEPDRDVLWSLFQEAISDALGIEPEEVAEDRGLFRDLGAE